MPTQIIDGFKLNSATPIDSRLVTTGTESRNSMVYKYEGLRVYDTIQKTPFVYINGAWSEESGGVTTTSTTTGGGKIGGDLNYIPKITEYGTTSSNIREYVTGNERWIGINIPESTQIETTLHVGGTVTATTFAGSLAATHITGILALGKIQNANEPTKTYVLKSINNKNNWVEEKIGSKINIENNTDYDKLFFAFTNDKDTLGVGNSLYIVNNGTNDLLAANSKTRQLMVGTSNNHINPQYSFVDKLGTGMYGNTSEVGLSMGGFKRIYVTSTMVGINIGNVEKFEVTSTLTTIKTGTTEIYSATSIMGTNTFTVVNGATKLGGTLAVTGATTLSSTLAVTGATTLSSTLAVTGATTLSSTLAVTGAATFSSTLAISTAQANVAFYDAGTTKRGSIGYGSNDDFNIRNLTNTGAVVIYTNNLAMLNIGTDTVTVLSGKKLELSGVVISALNDNQFNFANNEAFNGALNRQIYINYSGVSNGITAYRFHNGKQGTYELSPIVTGGIKTKWLQVGDESTDALGSKIHRIVVGSVNVYRDGTHVINKGSNYVKINPGQGTSTSGTIPVAAIQFKNPMPSSNYNVFVSYSHSVNTYPYACVAEVIDATNFKICVARTDNVIWVSGVVEVSFMAVCYDN